MNVASTSTREVAVGLASTSVFLAVTVFVAATVFFVAVFFFAAAIFLALGVAAAVSFLSLSLLFLGGMDSKRDGFGG